MGSVDPIDTLLLDKVGILHEYYPANADERQRLERLLMDGHLIAIRHDPPDPSCPPAWSYRLAR